MNIKNHNFHTLLTLTSIQLVAAISVTCAPCFSTGENPALMNWQQNADTAKFQKSNRIERKPEAKAEKTKVKKANKKSEPREKDAGKQEVAWSLPQIPALKTGSGPQLLDNGSIAVTISMTDAHSPISARVDGLMVSALANDTRTADLDKAVKHYNKLPQKMIASMKDTANFSVPFRGFGPSIEASNLILNKNVKIKTKAAADYAQQKHVDELHCKVISALMQMAMGMGIQDRTRGEAVTQSGYSDLKSLVGEKEATETLAMLSQWKNELVIDDSFYLKDPWDVNTRQQKVADIMSHSLASDAVFTGVTKSLSKYSDKSKFARVSSQVIQTSLGLAAATPTFVGSAAKVTLSAYITATGGPEQSKLMKQLYLDRRMESRWKLLNEESHLAVDNYQLGLLTRNPVLVALSEALVQEMTDADSSKKILGATVWADDSKSVAQKTKAASM